MCYLSYNGIMQRERKQKQQQQQPATETNDDDDDDDENERLCTFMEYVCHACINHVCRRSFARSPPSSVRSLPELRAVCKFFQHTNDAQKPGAEHAKIVVHRALLVFGIDEHGQPRCHVGLCVCVLVECWVGVSEFMR